MQFANPTGLLWLLLAVPIVIFYLLKVRLRQVPVSTLMFWDEVFEQRRLRSLWWRLRHPISLLLQLVFLALLALALSDPYFPDESSRARRVVLVVDNSASMNATDVTRSRLDEAKRRGHRLLRGLRAGEQFAIVSAGCTPRVVCGLTSRQRSLAVSLDAIPATDGPTRVEQAVAMARRLIAGQDGGQVIVLTDPGGAGTEEPAGAHRVDRVVIGSPVDNVGITQFQVRRDLRDLVGAQVFVEVTNFSDKKVSTRLEIGLEDQLIDVVPLALDPRERWVRVLDQTATDSGCLRATLDVEDALRCDNQAVAMLPRREPQPVTLVTEGSLFLENVLKSIPQIVLTVTRQAPQTVASGAIVVFHRRTPRVVPPGNVMLIDPDDSCDLWKLGGVIEDAIVATQDHESPLMTHVQLESVMLREARRLELLAKHQVLAASLGDELLYASVDRPVGKVLVLTVNLSHADLPLRTAFPIMMTNAIIWFQGQRGELRESLCTGSVTTVGLVGMRGDRSGQSADAQPRATGTSRPSLILCGPDGDVRPLPTGGDRPVVGPLDRCGIWQVESRDGSTGRATTVHARLACNLANAEESNLRRDSLPSRMALGGGSPSRRPIWFYVVAAALLLTTGEWYLYQRRWIS